jgi:hypothetical protein
MRLQTDVRVDLGYLSEFGVSDPDVTVADDAIVELP